MIDRARQISLQVLYKIDKENAYSNIALDEEINKNRININTKDIGLISEIVYGVTTWRLTLDEIIKKHSKIKLKKISVWILNILRMGIYQIIFLDKIPKSAAVNESVNLAKRYGHKSSSSFVNAILRKVDKKDYEELFEIKNNVERISKAYSMPEWIVEELLKENNIDEVEEICKNSNIRPKTIIRINNLKTNKKELLQKFDKKNIQYEQADIEDFMILNKVKNLENLEEFKNGLFSIQDEAAGTTAIVLNPKKGEKVLDACSAPGGKTTYIAELMENKGEIVAWDVYEHRLKLVNENANRLGINIIKTSENDASIYKEEYKEKFDKILLDVPCLGIGVLKRKPDIKWQKEKNDIEEITKLQYKILDTCSKYLKPGGTLVYSTCSIFKSENEEIIEKFLKENPEYKILDISNCLKNEKNKIENFDKTSRFLKFFQQEKNDGFFIAKLSK